MNLDQLLEKRGKTYGEFRHNGELAQQLKRVVKDFRLSRWESMSDAEKEALDFILSKLARELSKSANPQNYRDNLDDICGFCQLWVDEKNRLHLPRIEPPSS